MNSAFMVIVFILCGGLAVSLIFCGIALIKESISCLSGSDFVAFSELIILAFVMFFAGTGMFYITAKVMEYI